MQPMLQANNITVSYGKHTILEDVSTSVQPGEILALVGPNGAGKSTLLGVLSGDITPDSGEVILAGQKLNDIKIADAAKIRAVQVQENSVAFAFNAAEVVRLGRAAWAGTDQEERDDAVIYEVMETTDVTPLAQRGYPSLSGGEKARTTFARTLVQETAVLMLDEPTAAMDIRHQEQVLSQARNRADAGVAIVVVLHDLSVAAAYADRILLLEEGRVRIEGTPEEVLQPDVVSDVYGYPVTVIEHPQSGGLIVVPIRTGTQNSSSKMGVNTGVEHYTETRT
ncbi:MAG: heme ABC transporter ATP-binding protein [Yaniella sp.]|uniref:heme ABC transporter ATP-binding protein n=1 Tax=Yaniella sp. TaxID=2773929 RepID=UPI003F94F5A9